MIAKHVWQVWP